MRELSFMSVASDGQRIVLVDADGEEFTLVVDSELRRAITPQTARPTMQMKLPVDGPVTPKEVQNRLRFGATVEEVAAEAGMSLERVESFAVPVLQERSFIAQRAQACPVPSGGTLDNAVTERLLSRGITTEPEWDAWRRTDGAWTVVVRFGSDQASVSMNDETGTFTFDSASRSVVAEDDTARWLTNATEPAEPEPESIVVIEVEDDLPDWDPAHPSTRAARARAEQEAAEAAGRRGPLPTNPAPNGPGGKPLSRRAARRKASRQREEKREPTWDEILFGVSRSDEPTP